VRSVSHPWVSPSTQPECAACAQSLLNYCLLGLVHGTRWWLRARATGSTAAVWPPKLASPLKNYLLLAAVDVEANYLIVRAYQYTNITSVTLLDSARYGRDAHVRPKSTRSVHLSHPPSSLE
jgi:Solute carrier family 35